MRTWPNMALKPTRFRYAPAGGLALRYTPGERRNAARFLSNVGGRDMTLQRMDNVLIVVDDLAATKAFFVALGMELEGETTVEGPSVDRLIGLQNVRATLALLRTP